MHCLRVLIRTSFYLFLIVRRKVFEHISLLKAKENISEEEENDMLDYLYTTQYQMRGIVAVSLGEFLTFLLSKTMERSELRVKFTFLLILQDVLVVKIMKAIPMVCICVSKERKTLKNSI